MREQQISLVRDGDRAFPVRFLSEPQELSAGLLCVCVFLVSIETNASPLERLRIAPKTKACNRSPCMGGIARKRGTITSNKYAIRRKRCFPDQKWLSRHLVMMIMPVVFHLGNLGISMVTVTMLIIDIVKAGQTYMNRTEKGKTQKTYLVFRFLTFLDYRRSCNRDEGLKELPIILLEEHRQICVTSEVQVSSVSSSLAPVSQSQ